MCLNQTLPYYRGPPNAGGDLKHGQNHETVTGQAIIFREKCGDTHGSMKAVKLANHRMFLEVEVISVL